MFSFDVLSFSGDTVMEYSGDYTASTVDFDLTAHGGGMFRRRV
ncbi:MAG: hypothetical protein AB7F40_06350 [Victivallaceae bacterium]|nr:hypothetical protein [Victivallaceae bacterium]